MPDQIVCKFNPEHYTEKDTLYIVLIHYLSDDLGERLFLDAEMSALRKIYEDV